MPDTQNAGNPPAAFAAALASVRAADIRPELSVSEIAAPSGLAPWSIALAADVSPARHGTDSELGTGRFILLYDESQPAAWGGSWRVVCFAQAPLEAEIGVDPFLADVAWSWLIDALDSRSAGYSSASGTATKTLSKGFGELETREDVAIVELRASWSPTGPELTEHVEAWGELLCMLAGLPPAEGVSLLAARRPHRA